MSKSIEANVTGIKVDSKTNKPIMFKAYKQILNALIEQNKKTIDPTETLKKTTEDDIVSTANSMLDSDLKPMMGSLIAQMDEFTKSYDEEVGKYSDLMKAIQLKEYKLKELFDIEHSAFTLAALIDSHRIESENHTTRLTEKSDATALECSNKIELAQEKADRLNDEIKKTSQETRLHRIREQDEYDYNFKRDSDKRQTDLDDAIATRRKEFMNDCDIFKSELAEREGNIFEREQKMDSEESVLAKLRAQIEDMPNRIKEEAKRIFDKNKGIIESKHSSKIELLTVKHEGQVSILKAENEGLTTTINDLRAQMGNMSAKLDASYKQNGELATSAVNGAAVQKAMSQLNSNDTAKK